MNGIYRRRWGGVKGNIGYKGSDRGNGKREFLREEEGSIYRRTWEEGKG